jgi:hypothetical protein
MSNPLKNPTSHGQSGEAPANPVPEHNTWGGRDEVAGGPAGRGNDTGATVDTSDEWGAGKEPDGTDHQPVEGQDEATKNPFSK